MKGIFIPLLLCVPVIGTAVADVRDPRVGIKGNRFGPAAVVVPSDSGAPTQDRAIVASKNQLTASADAERSPSIRNYNIKSGVSSTPNQEDDQDEEKDKREAERIACLNNNIGVGNTFVWASRYSDTSNYATMQEDVDNPENNVCFAKVDIKSSDIKIDTSGIPSRYFQWGELINCGGWVDEEMLKQRILDGKKAGRTWATVGGAVGGAAVGVGAMELFGNQLIGGKVEGQKNKKLTDAQRLRSQLLTLKQKDVQKYDAFVEDLKKFKEACAKAKNKTPEQEKKCSEFEGLNI